VIRVAAILLLAAAAALAQSRDSRETSGEGLTAGDVKDIERLVGRLTAYSAFDRLDAQRQLAAYGRRVVPVLRSFDPEEPEARVRIDAVLRLFERIELTALLTANTHAVGAPVVIRIALINHTRESYMIPIAQGALTPFRITIAGRGRFLKRADVKFTPLLLRTVVAVAPGQFLTAEVEIEPDELPRDRNGTFPILITYTSRRALRLASDPRPDSRSGLTIEGDPVTLELSAPPMSVDIRTRTIRQLARALKTPAERARALVEIRFREDDDILPLLRDHAHDPDLRLFAIRGLGAKGDLQDLDLVRRATGDRNAAVRLAATLALGNFHHRKARIRLALLARDAELRLPAIRALTKHKHARTIDTFIDVLKHRFREGEWAPIIQKALLEWTDKNVRNTPSEIAAFDRWWIANRAEWRKKNERR